MAAFDSIPTIETIEKTIAALKLNGFNAVLASSAEDAKNKALALIPKGAEVFNATSVTVDTLGITKVLIESGEYNAVKNTLAKMDRKTQGLEMQKMGAAPEYVIGSVHAVTQDGKVLIASNSGSQIPSYVYGASHVVWVIGTQKIVENTDEGIKRIYDYVLPLESVRANKAYNITSGSFVSKILLFNREGNASRINIIFVNENIGF